MLLHTVVPLISFAACYKLFGVIYASGAMCLSSIGLIIYDYTRKRAVQYPVIIATTVASFMFLLSAFTVNETFVKMKPTVTNSLFALVLSGFLLTGRNPLKALMGTVLKLDDETWAILARRWVAMFALIAVLNEIVWRNCTEQTWVMFKLGGILLINVLFIVLQAPLISRNMRDPKRDKYEN
jgi:intracellular septation protein